MSAVITVDRISKRYRLGQRAAYGTLRDSITGLFSAPAAWLRAGARARESAEQESVLWALKDVSFDVGHGEIVGIIGRNGSGKSTLLKILSRITEPTTGRAQVHGRVGSLLEVGTGFHPELTGRENVLVNGAILGMKRRDIVRKFDEIVAFADVDRFIDTPVKHYSSGMQMRLAFAVAAHLEPNILLIDEVLAVGDLAFQKKCIGKMDEVSHAGRTVIFVSHQMNQLRRLCNRCIWLESGHLVDVGPTAEILGKYESSLMTPHDSPQAAVTGSAPARFIGWDLGPDGPEDRVVTTTGPLTVRFWLQINRTIRNAHHGIGLHDQDDRLMWGTGVDNLQLEPGLYCVEYVFEGLPLRPGPYRWHVTVFEDQAMLESYYAIPDLLIGTVPTGHRRDECAGFLNVPYSLNVQPAIEGMSPLRVTDEVA